MRRHRRYLLSSADPIALGPNTRELLFSIDQALLRLSWAGTEWERVADPRVRHFDIFWDEADQPDPQWFWDDGVPLTPRQARDELDRLHLRIPRNNGMPARSVPFAGPTATGRPLRPSGVRTVLGHLRYVGGRRPEYRLPTLPGPAPPAPVPAQPAQARPRTPDRQVR